MPAIKLTAFMQVDNGYGWSETHHHPGSSVIDSLAPYLNNFRQIMIDRRRPLLGRDAFYTATRASYRTGDGKIASAVIIENPGKQGTAAIGTTATWTTAQEVAAKLRMGNATQTAFSDIYLRGLWDAAETAGELDFDSSLGSQWKAMADQYVAALVQAGYGWLGIDPPSTTRGNVVGYTEDLGGFVTFTVSITSGPLLPATGTRMNIRVARLDNGKSVLNTTHTVVVMSPTTLQTVVPTAAGTFQGPGTFVFKQTGFIAYSAVQYWKLARRACGRPFGLTPGRARVRPRA